MREVLQSQHKMARTVEQGNDSGRLGPTNQLQVEFARVLFLSEMEPKHNKRDAPALAETFFSPKDLYDRKKKRSKGDRLRFLVETLPAGRNGRRR